MASRLSCLSWDPGQLMQLRAFSPGDYRDSTLALWSMATYELLASTHLPEPVHSVAFNPRDAGELACVGQGAITFWLVQQRGTNVSLQVPGFAGCSGGWGLAGPQDIADPCFPRVPSGAPRAHP